MIKIHAVPDAVTRSMQRSCRVYRVDSCSAVCMVHNPACRWATPYGNYCEHPLVDRIAEYDPKEGAEGGRSFLH